MKKMLAWLLFLSLLISLCACGGKRDVGAEPSAVSAGAQESAGLHPTVWNEDAVDNEGWGFTVAVSQSTPYDALPERWKEDGGCYYTLEDLLLTRYDLSGQALYKVQLQSLLTGAQEGQFEDVFTLCFGEGDLWLVHNVRTVVNDRTGECEVQSYLEHWTQAGEQLLSLPLDQALGLEMGDPPRLELSPEGLPLLISMNALLSLDENGAVLRQFDTGGVTYSTVRDRDGLVYCKDESTNLLYTIDWEQGAPGQELFKIGPMDRVRPGSGPYDFFLVSDVLLKGVDLTAGTITTLLKWEDCGLEGMVQDVTWVDENTYQVSGYDLIGDGVRYLDVTKVPEDQVPEKTPIRLAVPCSEGRMAMGMDWSSSLDSITVDAITNFNLTNETYRIEAVPYASAQELQLMMTTEPPDLIWWDDDFQNPPQMADYARRGLLTDLEPLIEADPDLDNSDFFPNVVEAARDLGGGLYMLPVLFYLRTLTAPAEYVGTEMGWTCADLFAVAQTMPENMAVMSGMTRWEMLDYLMDANIQRFADQAAGNCDFRNQDFYDLLTLCRDYFPETDGNPGESLLTMTTQLGTMGCFYADTLGPMKEQGYTLIGFPGAGGNGMIMNFGEMCSICALGPQPEGAWAFYRTLLGYDYQYAAASINLCARIDAQYAREEWFLTYNGSCTEEESLEARALIEGVQCLALFNSPIEAIVTEEVGAFFAGDKTVEETAAIIQNRAEIYLAEQG